MPNPTLNRRYQRLIDQLDRVHPSTREMFLYLFAMVAAGQGIISVVRVQEDRDRRVMVMNDPVRKQEFKVTYPEGLDPDYAQSAIAEMERLLSDESLGTSMDSTLFHNLYASYSCNDCAYNREEQRQICAECHFAGHPVNYEKRGEQ